MTLPTLPKHLKLNPHHEGLSALTKPYCSSLISSSVVQYN